MILNNKNILYKFEFEDLFKNINNFKEIKIWIKIRNQLIKNTKKWKELSNSLKEKEYDLWKLVLTLFKHWNKSNYTKQETNELLDKKQNIDINKFKEFKEEFKKNVNNFKLKNKIDELTEDNINVLSNTIETFILDIERSKKFLIKEKIKLINNSINDNDVKNHEWKEKSLIKLDEKLKKIESKIVNLEKKKINVILNFVIKVFSFGCIDKNKKVKNEIKFENNKLKNFLLERENINNQQIQKKETKNRTSINQLLTIVNSEIQPSTTSNHNWNKVKCLLTT